MVFVIDFFLGGFSQPCVSTRPEEPCVGAPQCSVVHDHNTDNITATMLIPGRAILAPIPWQDRQNINLLAIYTPNVLKEIREFWKTITEKINTTPTLQPDIVLGNFNQVEDAIDRIPCRLDDLPMTEKLREFRTAHNLIDDW